MAGAAEYGRLQFGEQVAFFRRKLNVNTEAWTDVLDAEHDVAFMVAGANRDDMVADFREAIDQAIAEGRTLREFRDDFDAIVQRYGWEYNGGRNWRSRVIYETNLRQSYNAGRWAQLQRGAFPFWRYVHDDSVQHPRPLHLAWNGLVLAANDPWWNTHFPANGWGCQCRVDGLSDSDMTRLGRAGPDKAPPLEEQKLTVGLRSPGGPRSVTVPKGIDPGFGYAPGRSVAPAPSGRIPVDERVAQVAQQALDKTARLPIDAAARSVAAMLQRPRIAAAVDSGYAEWQAAVVGAQRARNAAYTVGAIDPELAGAMTAAGVEPQTAAIVVRDAEVLHALRASKAARSTAARLPSALTADELAQLPALLRSAVAVVLDQQRGALLYIVEASTRREAGKLVIAIDYRLKTATGTETVNAFKTATLVNLADVRAQVIREQLVLLRGSLE